MQMNEFYGSGVAGCSTAVKLLSEDLQIYL